MPVKTERGQWQLLSDADLAKYLREDRGERKTRLDRQLKETGIALTPAIFVSAKDELAKAALAVAKGPVLVHHEDDPTIVVGILTAFDLL